MSIDYNHSVNIHTLAGPRAAVPVFFGQETPSSLLDVGCGLGTWLKAATDFGVPYVFGVDGVAIPPEQLHVPAAQIGHQDLTRPWDLNRRFAAAICFEVAEHLGAQHAPTLIDALVRHSDWILFSAACPNQRGQHHIHCQWPAYWQQLFNQRGFSCSDELRWQIWDEPRIEPWYRQNIFTARKNIGSAGREPRIKSVVHPEMLVSIEKNGERQGQAEKTANGGKAALRNLVAPARVFAARLKRSLT